MKYLLFAVLSTSGAAHAAGPMIEVPVEETCREHVAEEPRITASDWPERARGREINAYVVVSYSLDGSGSAQNAVVTDSKPGKLFSKTTLSILERTRFVPGVVADSCTYVRTYGVVRRAER